MAKYIFAAIVDEDIFDELCSYPDHRVLFMNNGTQITEEEFQKWLKIKTENKEETK